MTGSVAELPSSPQGAQSAVKDAAKTVADTFNPQAGPLGPDRSVDTSSSGGDQIVSSSVQGVEAVTENAAKQGPDAVPDQPQEGTAVQTSTQGVDQIPGTQVAASASAMLAFTTCICMQLSRMHAVRGTVGVWPVADIMQTDCKPSSSVSTKRELTSQSCLNADPHQHGRYPIGWCHLLPQGCRQGWALTFFPLVWTD